MRVCALRRTARPSPIAGVEMVTELPALLAETDHLVLALPATPATRQVIGGEALTQVKQLLGRGTTALCDECVSLCCDILDAELGTDWR